MDNFEESEQEESHHLQFFLKKKRLLIGFIIVVVLIVGGIFFLRNREFVPTKSVPSPPPQNLTQNTEQIPASVSSEGILRIRNGESLIFPSGAILELEGNSLYFSNNADVPRTERLSFTKKIAAYVSGYSHILEEIDCEKETRFFDDYYAPVVTQCSMQSSVFSDAKPSIPSYNSVAINFSSVASKNISRFRTLQEEQWVAIWVPYFQIAKSREGVVVNVVSPKEDTVSVYTNYGRGRFQFDAAELNNLQQKTIEVGPLTITLAPLELTCVGTYQESDGSCYTLSWEGKSTTSYNVVNFRITIEEKASPVDYPILVDIEK